MADDKKKGFGQIRTDHMLVSDFHPEKGWDEPKIIRRENFDLGPDSLLFHYGQAIFEGMKAYRSPDDEIFLFRPRENAERFYRSAERLAMPPIPIEMFLSSVKQLVVKEEKWIPRIPGSLYIRPFMIATEEGISYRKSTTFRFCVFVTPVENYYKDGNTSGVTVAVERVLSRAAPGGVGAVKCAGNYAAALLGVQQAKAQGAIDVMWLDAMEHKYVEEVGTMNLMFLYQDKIVTPSLTGTILPGITRSSVLKIAKDFGLQPEERRIPVEQVFADAESGKLKEVFGCGTAVIICPISKILDGSRSVQFEYGEHSFHEKIRKKLYGIQSGTEKDPFFWRVKVI